jgi:hypothetical protein
MGRVTGDASNNSLVNLSMARIITPEYVEELVNREGERAEEPYGEVPPSAPPEEAKPESTTPEQPPIAGAPTFPPDEEEEDFEAADADEDEQEDVEEQQREETV